MISPPPVAPPPPAPIGPRVRAAIRHPSHWLGDITGGGPVYALMILFGLNMVDPDGRHLVRHPVAQHPRRLPSVRMPASSRWWRSPPWWAWRCRCRSPRRPIATTGSASCCSAPPSSPASSSAPAWPSRRGCSCSCRSGAGIGQATVGPTHNPLIADWYPINSRPRVYSFYFGSNALGAFLGPILAGLLAAWLGWRAPFIVLSVPVVILVLLGLRLREPSRGIQERMAMGVTDALLTEEPPPSFAEGWRMVWKIESLRRIFFALPFLAASLVGFASLASLLYQQKFGLDVVQRGWVAAAAEPAQLVGLAIGAHVSQQADRQGPRADHPLPGRRRRGCRRASRALRPGADPVGHHRGQHGGHGLAGRHRRRHLRVALAWPSRPAPGPWGSPWAPSG